MLQATDGGWATGAFPPETVHDLRLAQARKQKINFQEMDLEGKIWNIQAAHKAALGRLAKHDEAAATIEGGITDLKTPVATMEADLKIFISKF